MRWLFPIGAAGSVITALCCVGILTPLLVALLVAAGLGALTRNLDLILFPALAVFLVLTFVGWRSRQARAVARDRGP
ncbi:MAG TPA: mercury resistance system transport protein MerF [Chloroflexota bacterium]|nr:mercury resistance system transport protein MerF [Chloroflexota bacterium]